jgi:hypothetical protein
MAVSKPTSLIKKFLFCGNEGNRTLHTLLAKQCRQPWNMRPQMFTVTGFEPAKLMTK